MASIPGLHKGLKIPALLYCTSVIQSLRSYAFLSLFKTEDYLRSIAVCQAVVGNAAVVRVVAPPLLSGIAEITDFLVADNSLLGKL